MSSNNTKTTATTASVPAGSLMDMLAGEIARQAREFKATEAKARAQAKEVIGADLDLEGLQTMIVEAESLGLPADVMAEFKAKAKEGREALITADAAGQMARRLAATTTVEGLRAHIDRAKAKQAADKAAAEKAKAQAKAEAEDKVKEARVEKILGDLGELTPGQRVSIAAFLRANRWEYRPTPEGRAALMGAAARATAALQKEAKAFRKVAQAEAQAAAQARAAAAAAAAPLTHKVSIKK